MSDIYIEHNRFGTIEGKGRQYGVLCLCLFESIILFSVSIDQYISCAKEELNPVILVFDVEDFIIWIVSICLALGPLVLAILWFTDYWSKIKVCKDGVLVKYPYFFIREKLIPWHEFQTVCICTYSNSARVYFIPDVYVCMVKYGEKKDVKGNWKMKNPLHFSRIIRLWYTAELVCFLQEKCGITVVDQRNDL